MMTTPSKHGLEMMMTQALLPENHELKSIVLMVPGDSGWTVPWAMWADGKRRLWLHPHYTIHSTNGGTVQMFVTREDDGNYTVNIGDCPDFQWSPRCEAGYASPVGTTWIPVATLRSLN